MYGQQMNMGMPQMGMAPQPQMGMAPQPQMNMGMPVPAPAPQPVAAPAPVAPAPQQFAPAFAAPQRAIPQQSTPAFIVEQVDQQAALINDTTTDDEPIDETNGGCGCSLCKILVISAIVLPSFILLYWLFQLVLIVYVFPCPCCLKCQGCCMGNSCGPRHAACHADTLGCFAFGSCLNPFLCCCSACITGSCAARGPHGGGIAGAEVPSLDGPGLAGLLGGPDGPGADMQGSVMQGMMGAMMGSMMK